MEHHIEATDGYDTAMYLSIAPAIEPATKVKKRKHENETGPTR